MVVPSELVWTLCGAIIRSREPSQRAEILKLPGPPGPSGNRIYRFRTGFVTVCTVPFKDLSFINIRNSAAAVRISSTPTVTSLGSTRLIKSLRPSKDTRNPKRSTSSSLSARIAAKHTSPSDEPWASSSLSEGQSRRNDARSSSAKLTFRSTSSVSAHVPLWLGTATARFQLESSRSKRRRDSQVSHTGVIEAAVDERQTRQIRQFADDVEIGWCRVSHPRWSRL